MTSPEATLVVWDSDLPAPADEDMLCPWYGYGDKRSVSSYLEKHADRLRARYAAAIHDLGERCIGGKRLVEHLDLGHGFSFWWATPLAEKSPLKSPRLFDTLRLLALDEIIEHARPASVRLVTADPVLTEAVVRLCAARNLSFELEIASTRHVSVSRRLFNVVPHATRAMLALGRHVVSRWRLRNARTGEWRSGADSIFILSYFLNVDEKAAARGEFHSRYWGRLPDVLRESSRPVNWLHQFLPSGFAANATAAVKRLARIGDATQDGETHAFLDSYLSWRVVFRVARSWWVLWRLGHRLGPISRVVDSREPIDWLWPLMRDDWASSIWGSAAISSLLWIELLERAVADLPPQSLGLYLCEHQGWERSLAAIWRKHGQGRLIGVAHSTVRFWDLRFVDDPRTLFAQSAYAIPTPDQIAVNGPASWAGYIAAGYPSDRLVAVEALRYLDSADRVPRPSARSANSSLVRVLVLGGIMPQGTRRMLQLISAALAGREQDFELVVKAHPANPISPSDTGGLGMSVSCDSLSVLLGTFDIAVAENSTSSALDAYLAGMQVIVYLDDTQLNFSPLRGVPGVAFVSTPEDLRRAMRDTHRVSAGSRRGSFFWLDPHLPQWRRVLAGAYETQTPTAGIMGPTDRIP